MDQFEKFYLQILETNQAYIEEAWKKWIEYTNETLKKEVTKSFPNGFKDYLNADIQNSIELIKSSNK